LRPFFPRLPLALLLAAWTPAGCGAMTGHGHPEPVYHIPLVVHLGESSRKPGEFPPVFEEIDRIWLSQAGICFEIKAVADGQDADADLSMWFRPDLGGLNGSYDGERILMKDHPILAPASHPARDPAARTAAHELGHALGLHHDQSDPDNLMASKTFGWHLMRGEIDEARRRAAILAQPGSNAETCGPPDFNGLIGAKAAR